MVNRPPFMDLRSKSYASSQNCLPSPHGPLLSPRLHVAGDVPPDLSPLDAFAAHSRRLAKQLEESIEDGKRMSRLPHVAVESSLLQRRPAFERSASIEDAGVYPSNEFGRDPMTPAVEEPDVRHRSVYARVSGSPPPTKPNGTTRLENLDEEPARGRSPSVRNPRMYGMRQEESPGAMDRQHPILGGRTSPSYSPEQSSHEPYRKPPKSSARRELHDHRALDRSLAPPKSPFAQRTPSPNSISNDSVDEDLMAGSFLSQPRKQSSSSAFSSSPASPCMPPNMIARSPSVSSELSVGGSRLSRPAFNNFSRPISRASVQHPDFPSRQASTDSQTFGDDAVHTPVSTRSTESFEDSKTASPAATYVYSRYNLPRGKKLQRNSLIFQSAYPTSGPSHAEQPANSVTAPSSPPSRPSTSSDVSRASNERGRPSYDHTPGPSDHTQDYHPALQPQSRGTASINSGSTIKARPSNTLAPSADASGEENVTKAIAYHERGELTKSTYHLRLAARQNHPTGMLLYALACRHGWGMRPNPKDGVEWLRKAVESASLEVADDEELMKDNKAVDVLEKKARKAQFALGIYELGVSHLNGWGIDQDKGLALRCFEIAGSWGDGDALAEAAFCYANGIGCKKNLKKAAKLYRDAESKGISMVGQSWIHKAKYQDEGDASRPPTANSPEKNGRSKSKSRGMFGRKKAN